MKERALDRETRKHTVQRALLLELIHQTEGHFDAHELYRRARERRPSFGLSTVYRNLGLFKKLGLVEEHQLDGVHRYYETRTKARHQHLVCLGCGEVTEFCCPLSENLKQQILREKGFQVTDAEVRLVGYCTQCQKQQVSP